MKVERVLGIFAARRKATLASLLLALVPILLLGSMAPGFARAATPSFGFSSFSAPLLGLDGLAETQAGGHPYELAATVDLNTVVRDTPEGKVEATSVQDLRDVIVDLPLGVVGSALSAPTCTLHELTAEGEKDELGTSGCPEGTIVGRIEDFPESALNIDSPLYNLVPEYGFAAQFGFIDLLGNSHVLDVNIAPTPAGYILRLSGHELPQVALTGLTIDVYGDPAARDGSRAQMPEDVPTFTNPVDCTGEALKTTIYMDSWQNPAHFNPEGTPVDLEEGTWAKATYESPPVTGCADLGELFKPEIEAGTEQPEADSPTGLDVDVKIPQQEGMGASGTGTPPLKEAIVSLPEGLTIDPSTANGLQACSESQIGYLGKSPDPSGEYENFTGTAPECPQASKLGTVQMETPMLPREACKGEARSLLECAKEEPAGSRTFPEREGTLLQGSIYLARQDENPFGSMFALYIVIDDPQTGTLLKLPAEVRADPGTGRLTIALEDAPQFPVSDLRLHFFGGSKALLSTPGTCGRYAVSSTLTPWSAPESGPPASASSSFEVSQAAGGGTCASSTPFAPAFEAGTFGNQAGAYSSFALRVSRQDSEQDLAALQVRLPVGVLANLAEVPPCPEVPAEEGTCAEASRIGTATIAAGAGADPLYLPGSEAPSDPIYLTGPYNGARGCTVGESGCAPFGLAIKVPAIAGPFNLGTVPIRARVSVNPGTGQLEIDTDPIPQILGGVPLQIKKISLTIDRPSFIFNSTGCSQSSVTGTVTSAQGATAPISNRFQAANCASLKFAPKLTAGTGANGEFQGHGASLHVAITAGTSSSGSSSTSQANMRALKLDLPQRLPARLATIQRACPESTFEANPAACPKASVVGLASVQTSILSGTMTGPAYLVAKSGSDTSRPGESKTEKEEAAFPDLVLVPQAQGVRIDLTGALFVSSKNITSVAFRSLPDVPIRRLDLYLPEGKSSILAASSGLCTKRPLTMFTAIDGQNGARLKPTVKVGVEGCRKAKRPKKKRHGKKKR